MKFSFAILFVAYTVIEFLDNVESVTTLTSPVNTNAVCDTPKCIMKCCPFGKHIVTIKRRRIKRLRICDYASNVTKDFASVAKDVFDHYPEISELNLTVKAGIFESNETFRNQSVSVMDWFNLHLTEYPEVYIEVPNAYNRWSRIPNDRFCWDHQSSGRRPPRPGIWILFPENPDYEPITRTNRTLLIVGRLVSCVLLALVLVVYGMLPDLWTLSGKTLLAYVASLLGAFLLLSVIIAQQYEVPACRALTFFIYFFFMASFSWSNVMSYDIWRTSRGCSSKTRSISWLCRRKFLVYCLYGFGVPVVMTTALVVINEVDMSHLPWFITPKIPFNGCFIEGGEKFLYLYVPMLIMMVWNWCFYLMTAINVWRLSRAAGFTAASAPHAQRKHKHRFLVYLKLSVVMGLSWVLEVAEFFRPGHALVFACDLYNVFIGLPIFLIFVCKRSVIRKLVKRWRYGQNGTDSISYNSDALQEELNKMQACVDPKDATNNVTPSQSDKQERIFSSL